MKSVKAQKIHSKALHNGSADPENCEICKGWVNHYENYRAARKEYKKDSKMQWKDGEICVSTDLQKVIMVPRMDTFKVVCFTKRLVAFNESFVPVAGQKQLEPFAAIWHEAIAGRKCEDIVSTYHHFFLFHREAKKIIIWLDNCAGQNKNWTFLSYLV